MIAFRHAHPVLRSKDHLRNTDYVGSGYSDISWHGTRAWQPDWGGRVLAFMLCGRHAKGGMSKDDYIYVAMNMYWDALPFEIPRLPDGLRWHVSVNTGMPSSQDIFEPGSEPELADQGNCLAGGRSVIILVGRSAGS
jgi:glycogen operon protein